jgi:hypothetical protein
MTNFLSLALGQTLECWFSSLSFCGNNQNFQHQAPPPTFFYVYNSTRSRFQQEHYLMILCSTIQEDGRTLFFLICGRN